MRQRLFLLSGLVFCLLSGCKHDADVRPQCYSGVVVGGTCTDGLLIDVDPAYPIGAPALLPRARFKAQASGDSLLGRNVVAVVNSSELLNAPGKLFTQNSRLYFTYVNDPKRQWNGWECLVFDGVTSSIPHLVLSNVSATACAPVGP